MNNIKEERRVQSKQIHICMCDKAGEDLGHFILHKLSAAALQDYHPMTTIQKDDNINIVKLIFTTQEQQLKHKKSTLKDFIKDRK